MTEKTPSPRPRRTREHVIASQCQNYVEKFFIDKGHTVDRPADDYGIDLLVNTFDERGYAEPGCVLFQLKASDSFEYTNDYTHILFSISAKHYDFWAKQPMPVFLVLYDAKRLKAYWLYVQPYFKTARKPKKGAKTISVRVPVTNELSAETVDYARGRKAAIWSWRLTMRNKINFGRLESILGKLGYSAEPSGANRIVFRHADTDLPIILRRMRRNEILKPANGGILPKEKFDSLLDETPIGLWHAIIDGEAAFESEYGYPPARLLLPVLQAYDLAKLGRKDFPLADRVMREGIKVLEKEGLLNVPVKLVHDEAEFVFE